MENVFPYSDTNKRYYTWNYYAKQTYKKRVYKVALDAGFSCPNRDGTCGTSGCTFCDNGSGDFAGDVTLSLSDQFELGKRNAQVKWKDVVCVPYFQAYSNTYASLERLKEIYDPFALREDVIMMCIATRCDCLDDDIIQYLSSLCKYCDIWLEIGLQTIHDESAKRISRGHTYKQFEDVIQRLSKTNIHICVHIINSLPYENEQDMLETMDVIAHLPIHAVKIHMLHIIQNTVLAQQYRQHPFPLLTREEYVDIVIKQLERLPKHMIIQRLTGDGNKDTLVAPLWTCDKLRVLNAIDLEMVRRNTYQGCKFLP